MPTVGWEGAREGTLDHRLLRAVERRANDDRTPPDTRDRMTRWLEDLRRSVQSRELCPYSHVHGGIHGKHHFDQQDTHDPGHNLDEIRRKAVELLERHKGGH